MSMLATTHFEEDGLYNPDEVQVPESSLHRSIAVLIQLVVADLLGDRQLVRANLNWYPADEGNAVAPDVMVFDRPAVAADASSYRQGADDPTPVAVVEVPSDSDTVTAFSIKQARYHRLGTTVYSVDPRVPAVSRFDAEGDGPRQWLGRPCPELGGIVFQVNGDDLVVWMPEGVTVASAEELLALRAERAGSAEARAESAETRAESAEARAESAEAHAERLAARLRAAGLDAD